MQRFGAVLFVSAVFSAGAASAGPATSVGFQLRLPVPAVGPTQCLPPGAIAQRLTRQRFKIQKMYRKGPAYAVAATGPSGNKVLMMVDGRSGGILGLNVLTAVVQVTPQRAPNAVFIDDRHPFGAVVPAVIYDTWQEYSETQWAVASGPIAITASFAPFHYAVPFNYVHVAPRTGRSFAVAPPRYRGYQIRSHSGQPIRDTWTRSEAADAQSAYQSERADQADFDKINAQQDAAYANGRADAFQEDNANLIAAQADAADQRTSAADLQEAETQADLEKNGDADQHCGAGDCGDIAANPDDGAAPADQATPADDTAAPQEAPVPEEQAAPAEQPVPEEQAAPAEQPAPEEAAPQEQAAPAQEEQAAPQEQAAPEEPAPQEQAAPEEPAPQEQAAPEEQPQDNGGGDMGGGENGGGSDGGGGDDGGGGGGDGGGGDDGGG
jgi:hypothetical protein